MTDDAQPPAAPEQNAAPGADADGSGAAPGSGGAAAGGAWAPPQWPAQATPEVSQAPLDAGAIPEVGQDGADAPRIPLDKRSDADPRSADPDPWAPPAHRTPVGPGDTIAASGGPATPAPPSVHDQQTVTSLPAADPSPPWAAPTAPPGPSTPSTGTPAAFPPPNPATGTPASFPPPNPTTGTPFAPPTPVAPGPQDVPPPNPATGTPASFPPPNPTTGTPFAPPTPVAPGPQDLPPPNPTTGNPFAPPAPAAPGPHDVPPPPIAPDGPGQVPYGYPAAGYGYPAPQPTYGGQYTHGAPGYYGWPGGGQAEPSNGLGTAGMVVGIIAVAGFCLWPLAILLGILGVIFGGIGRAKANRGEATNPGQALAGIICGVVGLVLGAGFGVLVLMTP